MSRFMLGGVAAQDSNAACAASTAWIASGTPADDARWMTLPVEGLVTSIVLAVVTSWPFIRRGTVNILAEFERLHGDFGVGRCLYA